MTVQAGDEIPLAQAKDAAPVRVAFLSARQDLLTPPDYRPNDDVCKALVEKPLDFSDNANSLSLVLELGRLRFFDGGDLTWNVEGRLVSRSTAWEPSTSTSRTITGSIAATTRCC